MEHVLDEIYKRSRLLYLSDIRHPSNGWRIYSVIWGIQAKAYSIKQWEESYTYFFGDSGVGKSKLDILNELKKRQSSLMMEQQGGWG